MTAYTALEERRAVKTDERIVILRQLFADIY